MLALQEIEINSWTKLYKDIEVIEGKLNLAPRMSFDIKQYCNNVQAKIDAREKALAKAKENQEP